ncbi:MAG: hypothetical protein QNJ32_04250 [Xenococcaceae cyanobacterium MO_167.B27]|nr:hypothetical protein [Xenococcaceae cyanobacterium MO_167.B27]
MLTQFRHYYPQGSLISELINIDRGLYLVRVSIETEGVTLATGLAGADTIELAEDRARERAIAALGLDKSPVKPSPTVTSPKIIQPSAVTAVKHQEVSNSTPELKTPQPIPSPVELENHQPNFTSNSSREIITESKTEKPSQETQEYQRNIFDQPIVENSASPESISAPETEVSYPPVEYDYSEIAHKIDLEMKRLNWTKDQGRDYLLSTYGKRSRLHLKNNELLEFLDYLETLPSS